MKTRLLFLLSFLLFAPFAHAQYPVAVVADPIAVANHVEDIADFLVGALGERNVNFALIGERL